jgi:hypothetical protein
MSLKDHLDELAEDDGLSINIRVGRKNNSDFTLPCITCYFESETNERLEIGSNNTFDRKLFIFDIFATGEGERLDLAEWLKEAIRNGWKWYSYVPNESTPFEPTKTEEGRVSINFLTNMRVTLGDNVDPIDQFRHRITVQVWM